MSLWSCPVSALAHISTAQPVAGPYGPHGRTKAGNHLMSGGARDCRHLSAVPCLAETGQVFNPPTSGLALSVLRIEKPSRECQKKRSKCGMGPGFHLGQAPGVFQLCPMSPVRGNMVMWKQIERIKGHVNTRFGITLAEDINCRNMLTIQSKWKTFEKSSEPVKYGLQYRFIFVESVDHCFTCTFTYRH